MGYVEGWLLILIKEADLSGGLELSIHRMAVHFPLFFRVAARRFEGTKNETSSKKKLQIGTIREGICSEHWCAHYCAEGAVFRELIVSLRGVIVMLSLDCFS